MIKRFLLPTPFIALILALLTTHAQNAPPAPSEDDWASCNRTLRSERYSYLAQIHIDNVAQLKPVATFHTGEMTNFETGPLVIGGTLYLTTDQNTYAVDARTGELKWRHNHYYAPPTGLRNNRGLAYLDGKLFRGAGDGHVFAIDAETGETVWDVPHADPKKGEGFPAAPIAWNGLVFIGNSGGDNFGVKGRMLALDAATGVEKWRFDIVASDKDADRPGETMAAKTWPTETPQHPRSGGATWTSYSLEPVQGLLYIPAGNPAPDFVKALRPGKTLFANSLLVLDARTGAYRSHNLLIPNDEHDWDLTAAPALVSTRAGKRIALQGAKDGYVYAVDVNTMRLLYKTPTTRMFNTTTPLSPGQTVRFAPGFEGGVQWNGPAYHPDMNAFFVGSVDWPSSLRILPPAKVKGKPGAPYFGFANVTNENFIESFDPPDTARGYITCADADTGRVRWQIKTPRPQIAGVVATGGGLIFTGSLTGYAFALDARNGKVVWRSNVKAPIGGGVITYAVEGKQYVAVAAGIDSASYGRSKSPAKVVLFALP